MTQKEAIIKALEEHGGRERLPIIYPRVIQLAKFKPGSDKQATIRTTLQRHPESFCQSPGKPKGWWELVSYQEDIACRDQRIAELEELLAVKEKEIAEWKNVPTEDDFVKRFVKKVKHHLKRDKKTVEEIRKLMDALGRMDADKELDEWLQGKDKKNLSRDRVVVTYNAPVGQVLEHVERVDNK